jgi:hypothetical protein
VAYWLSDRGLAVFEVPHRRRAFSAFSFGLGASIGGILYNRRIALFCGSSKLRRYFEPSKQLNLQSAK